MKKYSYLSENIKTNTISLLDLCALVTEITKKVKENNFHRHE